MITYRLANTQAKVDQAIALISEVYFQEGYTSTKLPTEKQKHLLHSADAKTILGYRDNVLEGTISIVHSTNQRLPMEQIYATELSQLPYDRSAIAEVCQFAVRKSTPNETQQPTNIDLSLGLLSHIIHVAIKEHIECLCFTINPKHQIFYRGLGCTQIGPERSYPFVNNAPALAFSLEIVSLFSPATETTQAAPSPFLKKILDCKPQASFFSAVPPISTDP